MKRMTCTATCSLDLMILYTTSYIIVVFVRVSDVIPLVYKKTSRHIFVKR